MKITEEDVVRAYTGLVRVCVQHMRGVEREEALAVAHMGLLYAIRTWRQGMDFEEYAKEKIKEQVAEFKRDQNRQKRAESMLSLNAMMNPGEGNSGTFGDILAVEKADDTVIDVALFLRGLSARERHFVELRMQGYNNHEISWRWNAQYLVIDALCSEIQRKAADYFGLIDDDIPRGGADCG